MALVLNRPVLCGQKSRSNSLGVDLGAPVAKRRIGLHS
jgi:hypothetical protein